MSATSHGQLKKHPAIIEPFTIPFDTEVQCICIAKLYAFYFASASLEILL